MYLFEFKHTLTDQDLADIWQGVMPDISRNPQLSYPATPPEGRKQDIDLNVFTHPTGRNEFFHGKNIPDDIRWMVFKVKRKANYDYFKMTADTTDDPKFDFKFSVGDVKMPYSYNWPYDYFSLVELAEMEISTTVQRPDGETVVGQATSAAEVGTAGAQAAAPREQEATGEGVGGEAFEGGEAGAASEPGERE